MRLQVLLVVLLVSPGLPLEAACSAEEEKWTLGFGSCHHQLLPAPVLDVVASKSPGVFVWLGDNIYNDISRRGLPCTPGTNCNRDLGFLSWAKLRLLTLCTQVLRKVRPELMKKVITDVLRKHNRGSSEEEVEALRMNYEALASKAEFKRLREAVPTQLATWDDHDYCRNDGDSICWFKNESRALFLDFWRPDRSGASRKSSVEAGAAAVGADEFAGHDEEGGRGGGIYESYTFDAPGAVESAPTRIKVIILDTRFNRSPLPFVDEPGCTSEATTNSSSGDPDSRGGEKGKEKREKKKVAGGVDSVYCAVQDPAATLLGEEQWQWLEGESRLNPCLLASCPACQSLLWPCLGRLQLLRNLQWPYFLHPHPGSLFLPACRTTPGASHTAHHRIIHHLCSFLHG